MMGPAALFLAIPALGSGVLVLADSGATDPANPFAQLGVYAITVGILFYYNQKERARSDRIEAQAREDQRAMQPALLASATALARAVEALDKPERKVR